MRAKMIYVALFALLTVIVSVFQSCEKEEENQAPTCKITSPSNLQEIKKGDMVTIAVAAQDSDGTIFNVRLFVDNIGISSTVAFPYEFYLATEDMDFGLHTISVTSIDNDGSSSSDEITIILSEYGDENTAPNALFTLSTTNGLIGADIAFNASGCTDNEDPTSKLKVRWDFDGDGSWDTDWSTDKTDHHQYSSVGTYTPKVKVKDTRGLTDESEMSITIVSNFPPSALFTVSPPSGLTSTTFAFDASGCTDSADPLSSLEVRWDFDGDDVWDTEWDSDKTIEHQYSSAGTFSAVVEVRDTEGLKDQYTKSIEVAENTPPTALFTVSLNSGAINTNFYFNASGCSDFEDPTSQLKVRWDFEGDGSWDTDWDTDKTESYQYNNEGTYNATVEVKDVEGLTDQYSESITITRGCDGQTSLTYGGQTYAVKEIGTQCWMAENLNYVTEGSKTLYDNPANGDIFGRLYTWQASLDACPSGWHLPSDEEWKILEMKLGMSQSQADEGGWRGTYEGAKMKSTSGWFQSGNGVNSSGFNALPGGYCTSSGFCNGCDTFGHWWSSTEDDVSMYAKCRDLTFSKDKVSRDRAYKSHFFSVRCVKD